MTCLTYEGYFLFSGAEDGTIFVWDLHQLQQRAVGATGVQYIYRQDSETHAYLQHNARQ